MIKCPCGSDISVQECCQVFISGQAYPSTPEQLMRSRYTAYTQADMNYIARTMKPPASNDFDIDATREWAKRVKWIKLNVINTSLDQNRGFVEYQAHYSEDKKIFVLHEISEFHLLDGNWYYVDGRSPNLKSTPQISAKIPRNDPCPCGSKKKYKKCCGGTDF